MIWTPSNPREEMLAERREARRAHRAWVWGLAWRAALYVAGMALLAWGSFHGWFYQ